MLCHFAGSSNFKELVAKTKCFSIILIFTSISHSLSLALKDDPEDHGGSYLESGDERLVMLSPCSPALLDTEEGECPLVDAADRLFSAAAGDDLLGVFAELSCLTQQDDTSFKLRLCLLLC